MLFIRFGLLSVVSFVLASIVLTSFPYALSGWYSHAGYFALGFVLLVAGYGFYTSELAASRSRAPNVNRQRDRRVGDDRNLPRWTHRLHFAAGQTCRGCIAEWHLVFGKSSKDLTFGFVSWHG
jgi:hypothetical protein